MQVSLLKVASKLTREMHKNISQGLLWYLLLLFSFTIRSTIKWPKAICQSKCYILLDNPIKTGYCLPQTNAHGKALEDIFHYQMYDINKGVRLSPLWCKTNHARTNWSVFYLIKRACPYISYRLDNNTKFYPRIKYGQFTGTWLYCWENNAKNINNSNRSFCSFLIHFWQKL